MNKVVLIGRAGKDAVVRYSADGNSVFANVSMATTSYGKDKKEATTWHNLIFYDKTAKVAGEYIKTGTQFGVEGSIKHTKWEDKNGDVKEKTIISVSSLYLLGSKADTSNQSKNNDGKAVDGKNAATVEEDDGIPF